MLVWLCSFWNQSKSWLILTQPVSLDWSCWAWTNQTVTVSPVVSASPAAADLQRSDMSFQESSANDLLCFCKCDEDSDRWLHDWRPHHRQKHCFILSFPLGLIKDKPHHLSVYIKTQPPECESVLVVDHHWSAVSDAKLETGTLQTVIVFVLDKSAGFFSWVVQKSFCSSKKELDSQWTKYLSSLVCF